VQCLYCGKGIGPIRQLRDLEFCSEAHRNQFRERYRQRAYEALAPDPAPSRFADFIEQPVCAADPVPHSASHILSNTAPDGIQPTLGVRIAGIFLARAEQAFGPTLATKAARPIWHESTTLVPLADRKPAFAMTIAAPAAPGADSAQAQLAPEAAATQPRAAALTLSAPKEPLPHAVALPEAAQTPGPMRADPRSPQLQAAVPMAAEPAAVGPVASATRAIPAPRSSATVAGPALPSGQEPPKQIGLSALAASLRRPAEAGLLPLRRDLSAAICTPAPVAFEASMRPASQPAAEFFFTPAVVDAVARPAAAMVTALPAASPRVDCAAAPIGALAGSVQNSSIQAAAGNRDPRPLAEPAAAPMNIVAAHPGFTALPGALASAGAVPESSCIQAAAGNRGPRSLAEPTAVSIDIPVTQPEFNALPGALAAAPPHAAIPQPAAPPAAAPTWDGAHTAPVERALVPLGNITVPPIVHLPAPAGAIAGPESALRPDVGRAVRSCAVLWTLRVARVFSPLFSADPVKVQFQDLVRANKAIPYVPEAEDARPKKTNVRPFKKNPLAPSRKQKWQYIGVAAAALLLAGVLRPEMGQKSFRPSFRWSGLSLRQWVTSRAARNFEDDFRGGLNQWKSVQARLPKNWSYSSDGFMHPGQLALYRPSVPLSDYKFEFMAQIESKSVDWVVRAHDADNYYALKFTVVEPGPRPLVAMVRYPVIEGTRGPRVQTPVRMMIHANTPYRVTVDVKGNHYRTFIEGQEADFWTDDRLKTGGAGFFTEAGERARVYWVKLESQGDFLGRICGLLSGKGSGDGTNKENEAMDYRHAGTTNAANAGLSGVEVNADMAQETRIGRVLSKAASLHLDGKREEAARELVRVVDGGERHPALFFALGQLQYEMEDYLPASQSYGQAAVLQPLHPTAHFNSGVCLGRLERWQEAVDAFKKAIANDPARVDAHLALGACLVQLGRYNEALDAYDRFLARHPDNDEALFGKAVALQKRDRTSEAVELYKRILNRNPNSEEALSNLVSLSLANQDYEQVRKYAKRLAEVQPKSQIAYEGMAGAAFAAGDHQAAAEYSRKLAELAPQVFENWFNLGVACHKGGDLANAADAYAQAAKVQPDSPQAHLNLGVALQEQGDAKAARKAYERALAIDPKLAGVHWNLGLVHEQLGDTDSAERLYAQVPENSPDSEDAAFRIGHLRLERGDFAGSIQAFEECLVKRPSWQEARLNLGIAHWRADNKDAARTCFQELTASGGDSKEALRGLAALSLEHQDYDQAFAIYRQLLDAGERSPELLYNAGLICQKRGQPEDAAVLYKEALKGDPQFGEALLNLGHALMTLGNEFEARSCWRKAVIAKPELAQRYFEPAQVAV
jgi:tetratricopeptide (TPR) repeat protein